MPESTAKDDIADLMKRLSEPTIPTPDASRSPLIRLIVATDWREAAAPLAVLKAYRVIVPAAAPMQLAFAVPHEPTLQDAECVSVLVEGAGGEGSLSGLEVLSFEQAPDEPYDAAVVSTGSSEELITEVGGLIVRMHDVVRRLESSGYVAQHDDPTMNVGDRDALRRRLALFRG